MAVTARGVCYGTEPYPAIEGAHTNDGEGKGVFTSTLKELQFKTIYYARAYATNKLGTTYGEHVKFTTEEGVAVVVTDSVIRITAHSAKCKGHVVSDGGFAVTKRGTCWSKRPDPTVDDDCTDDGSGLGEFTSLMKNLTENTTYYVRTYATNSTSTSYGEQVIITTLDGLAVVKTDSVFAITATGFTAYGKVVSDCDIPVTARGFCYATTQYPTIENEHTTVGKGLGKYQGNITNLKVGTTYYLRAYATNETATTYGEQIEVTTLDGLPAVETKEATSTATTVTVVCEVTETSGFDVTERGVCYSTENMKPTIDDAKVISGKGKGTYNTTIKEAQAATKYYVRAYATNTNGTAYGEIISIQTKDGNASVILGEVTDITALTASASVTITDNGNAALQSCGICWSTNPNPTTADNKTVAAGKQLNTAYVSNMSELQPNTTYYVRAYATTDVATAYSEQKTFITKSGSAIVTLGSISNITALTASASVTVNDANGATLQSCGICWSTQPNPTIMDNKTVAGGRTVNTVYTCNMSELTPNTTYFVCAYATTDIATAYSEQKIFSTNDGLPIVSTASTTATSTSITSGGSIKSNGGYDIIACGICYSKTNSNPTIENEHIESGSITNEFSLIIPNVSLQTTYYVRAYAQNNIGIAYGNVVLIKTGNGLPTVVTAETTMNGQSIISGGNVTDDGGFSVTSRGVCYGSFPNPDLSSSYSHTSDGIGTGYYLSDLGTSLTGVVYVRAYATNINGTAYGNQKIINVSYLKLPSFSYGGHTYKVAPCSTSVMNWNQAKDYCNGLKLYDFSDWLLPSKDELLQMFANKNTIGGFGNSSYWSSTFFISTYNYYYTVDFSTGQTKYWTATGYSAYVRPIRKDK